MSMKFKIIMLLVALMMSVQVWSDNPERVKAKFDPKRFEAEMEQFITSQAALSPSEAASFFPVYREMQKKARVLFEEMRRCHMTDLSNQRACKQAIIKMDELDLELKEVQRTYHLKFMKVLSPAKVLKIIKAEEKFHRTAFKRMVQRRQNND